MNVNNACLAQQISLEEKLYHTAHKDPQLYMKKIEDSFKVFWNTKTNINADDIKNPAEILLKTKISDEIFKDERLSFSLEKSSGVVTIDNMVIDTFKNAISGMTANDIPLELHCKGEMKFTINFEK